MARPRLRRPGQSLPTRLALGVYEKLASLELAVLVIASAAVVLGWATVVEGRYGADAVRFGIYGTWWFAALNLLLGVNVLAAALIRFPWKRHQTGFLITHAGILVLLVGCLLSRVGGIDAQLPVFEGDVQHTGYQKRQPFAYEDTRHFQLTIRPHGAGARDGDESSFQQIEIPFASGPFNWDDYREKLFWFPWSLAHRDQGVIFEQDGIRLEVLDYYADSKLADFPEFNRQAPGHGVFGTYWLDASAGLGQKKPADPESPTAEAHQPRVDVMQGADGRLYYRTWSPPHVGSVGRLPSGGDRVEVFRQSEAPLRLSVVRFTPHDLPGRKVVPLPYTKTSERSLPKEVRARLRVTVDGTREEFWLEGMGVDPFHHRARGMQRRELTGDGRTVELVLRKDQIDVGFRLYLHDFQRKLDPGTSMASHYSSLVDLRDRDDPENVLAEKVLITLNEPVNVSDPATGRSYRVYQEAFRGPWRPGDPLFNELVSGDDPRDEVFLSWLTVNYDPGRGLKYFGSLMIVAGIATMFYMKAYFFKPKNAAPPRKTKSRGPEAMVRAHVLPLFVMVLAASTAVAGQSPDELDWSAWQRLPVFHDGRMMPLDSFARLTADTVCGREHPELSLKGVTAGDGDEPPGFAETRELFPGGEARKFTAAELLFRWIVEPERWENVPFLKATNEGLREDWLEVPVTDLPGVRRLSIFGKTVFEGRRGNRLKYVSPRQVQQADPYWKGMRQLAGQRQRDGVGGSEADLTPAQQGARELYDALAMYRLVTFDPVNPATNRSRFQRKLAGALTTWNGLQPNLEPLARLELDSDLPALVAAASDAAESLAAMSREADVELSAIESPVVDFARFTAGLAEQLASHKEKLYQAQPRGLPPGQLSGLRASMHALAATTAKLARQAKAAHRALYDNGYSLRLVPGLNPAALENSRDPEDDAQPWVNLQTLLAGSDELLKDYPARELRQFRAAFRAAADAYVDRGNPDRPERFARAMGHFAASVRSLGEAIEPVRRDLPLKEEDKELVALTAYPPPEATAAELHYQRLNPFLWSWLVSLLAMACLGLAFGAIRGPMFWLGILALVAAEGFTIYGLGLRVAVTGWAPVTNMFETVIFVALVVGLLGLWFVLSPMFGPGLRDAWRMTAVPGTVEARQAVRNSGFSRFSPPEGGATNGRRSWWNTAGWLLLVPRLALAAAIFTALTLVSYGTGEGYTAVSLTPRTDVGSSMPTLNDMTVWAVGMGVLLLTLIYLPRAALTLLLAPVTVPRALAKQGLAKPARKTLARKPFALAGASVALLAALVAYYAPISGRNISPLMPVLRDNFWLTIHVLTITASYGAGALAWGLGNIALGHYLFGRYRDPAGGHPEPAMPARRPPVACEALGSFTYKAVQVAVLLLATGTILGALWADVSWGRFWGWDPKEVWALVSTLVYLAVLHGRYTGWFGNFGMAVAAVLGASSIMMAWYGVNRLGSGLHSYASVQGGVAYVVGLVAANWAFLGAAAIRYALETRTPRIASQESTP